MYSIANITCISKTSLKMGWILVLCMYRCKYDKPTRTFTHRNNINTGVSNSLVNKLKMLNFFFYDWG